MFSKVLIANRGEIALRVARTCREMGLSTVAAYSTEDTGTPAVAFADETVRIGPAAANRSYRNAAALLEAALRTGASAIHPGYGFLSEDADFAEACEENGITFIGPPAPVLATLSDKIAARTAMAEAGLPLLPGSIEPVADAHAAHALADSIGYPVIIKATAGGGGKGMRIVTDRAGLVPAYRAARSSALALFGSGQVYIERYLAEARHVEVQVLCDAHRTALHLGERDCTVQRRHQKLIEETPAPRLPRATAEAMCTAAVRGALAVGYRGAGTFEFLVDRDDRFYFMEVNPRIQVEHPVTEMVTGIDLVREQINIAAGRALPFAQADVAPHGVAIECRVNAEDPARDFAPTPGVVETVQLPAGPFTRVDTYVGPGSRVSAAYDSLVAKVVVWGPDRPQALARMRRALGEVRLAGPGMRTTAGFLADVLAAPAFVAAEHTTALIGTDGPDDGID
ncbi:acetyl-CoA carboxylase biotin carboxylase subunit [Saccharopolyspora sp. 5N708]|uniref:acetyl-CoA carboxylase biotin carboxylase subunit n=1 Tax=Saccharopolyspora sp. 5N708 TaxID=3457424 RepID=UPI003FCFA706